MATFTYNLTIGIDVSAEFSYIAIVEPNGDIYRKSFKIDHDLKGFDYLVEEIKKAEKELSSKPAIFMESTGVYHIALFHYLKKFFNDVFIINPLITNSNKNNSIRKVKNDKKDALSIAHIGKFQNIKYSTNIDFDYYLLKSLVREYYKLRDDCSQYKKRLSADLRVIFPNYNKVFRDTCSKTSLALLNKYPSPSLIKDAAKDKIIELLKNNARRSIDWCEKIYLKLISIAKDALAIGVGLKELSIKINVNISIINAFTSQIDSLMKDINNLLNSTSLTSDIKQNVSLLTTIPGIGELTAITLVAEIGDFNRFKNSKSLVAYLGIDPSINESGNFKSSNNSMSKRGSNIGRRAIYTAALSAISIKRNGEANNEIILEYYKNKLKAKKPKVALGAIMHKIVRYIFSVIKKQKPYEERHPEIHCRMFLTHTA
ncbi:IS110 family transposase [Clostridium sp. SHJSY1]|uniref:IS110 family transposase n=1 Tax=Clostridium sp. SHJSY1 TaxID=2942483 RepID=UPI0028751587|nr:IS110 family transposase [Clostridium sp. SHJSY1]MDS0528587.1 IS110 family transposase [Clostridium sp. SHJSY1]